MHAVAPGCHDLGRIKCGVQGGDIGRGGDEIAVHHQQGIDRLMHARRPQRMAGQRFGRGDRRRGAAAKDAADRLHLGHVAHDGRGAVRVDIVDLAARRQGGHGQFHRPLSALARGGDHVVAVRGGAVTRDFAIDFRAARQGVRQFLEHHHTAAPGDDEPVTGGVIGARGGFGGVVILAAHRAHGVEQARQGPVQFFSATGKDNVLFAHLDQFDAVADAMRRGRAGAGDGIVDALDLERSGEARRVGAAHAAGDHEGAHLFRRAFVDHRVKGGEKVAGRWPARPHDQARAFVGHVGGFQPAIRDGLLHGEEVIGGARPHEPQVAFVDMILEHDLRLAFDL